MDATVVPRGHAARLHFGAFALDLDRAELRREGALLALRPKAFALLSYLTRHPQRVLAKDELLGAVWPDVTVTDDSVSQCVSELRAALGDRDASLIKTVSRRGYLFDTAVRAEAEAAAASAPVVEVPVAADPPEPRTPPPRRRGPWIAASIAGLVMLVAAGWVLHRAPAPTRIDAAVAERRSIVVMPFADLSDPPAPHVVQAIDVDLTTDLGRLADTRVMASASAAVLGTSANVDIKRVGRDLDVRHVVTGSVRRDGERLHIAVQLIRTDTGALLWSERFDYVSAADWIAHRDVSARIANVLDVRMQAAALELARQTPPNDAALDHWMRGSYMMGRVKTRADLLQARSEFEAALAAQPKSSRALAGLAKTHVREVFDRMASDRNASLETAERLARRALEIDPHDQSAMDSLSGALMFNGRLDEAMAIVRRRLAANPNDAYANRDLAAVLYFYGRWDETLRQLELPLRLNPLDKQNLMNIDRMAGSALIALHRYDEAIEHSLRHLDGPGTGGRITLAAAEALRGNLPAAQQYAAEVLKRQPDFTIARFRTTRGSTEPAYVAFIDHFCEGLRLAGLPEGTVAAR